MLVDTSVLAVFCILLFNWKIFITPILFLVTLPTSAHRDTFFDTVELAEALAKARVCSENNTNDRKSKSTSGKNDTISAEDAKRVHDFHHNTGLEFFWNSPTFYFLDNQ